MRLVTLPSGERVTLAAYVKAWRLLKTLPPGEMVRGWQWFPVTAREALADIRRGIEERINEAIPTIERGVR